MKNNNLNNQNNKKQTIKKETIEKLNSQFSEPTCGVDRAVLKDYAYEDHRWTMPMSDPILSEREEVFKDLVYFAKNACVAVGEGYLVRAPGSASWNERRQSAAEREVKNTMLGMRLPNNTIITDEFLSMAFKGYFEILVFDEEDGKEKKVRIECGSLPIVDGETAVPLGPTTLRMFNDKGARILNTWVDARTLGNEKYVSHGASVLRLLYRALCSGEKLHDDAFTETEMLLEQIANNKFTNDNFRFAINWLAALVQRPGINLLTNLWFVGTRQGNGKGTLVSIMNNILGTQVCTKLSDKDVLERGWNSVLSGKQLVEVDEIQESRGVTKEDWNRWIKATTCEPKLTITARGREPITVVNVANYIFTSNSECPIEVEAADRRNQFIRTCPDTEWVEFSSALKNEVSKSSENLYKFSSGFAWILERVKLDLGIVNRAFINELKREIIESSQNSVEMWLSKDTDIVRNDWVKSGDLYELYKSWCNRNNKGEYVKSAVFGKLLSRLNWVEKKTVGGGKSQYLIGIPSAPETFDFERGSRDLSSIICAVTDTVNDLDSKADVDNSQYNLSEKQLKLQAMRNALKLQSIAEQQEIELIGKIR